MTAGFAIFVKGNYFSAEAYIFLTALHQTLRQKHKREKAYDLPRVV